MSRLIDADALIDRTDDRYSLGEIGRREHDDIVAAVEFAPTIEPERKNGKWIPQDMNKSYGMISTTLYYYPKCSVCGHCADYTNFCPNCGSCNGGDDNGNE